MYKGVKSPNNLFDELLIECQKSYTAPAHTLQEIHARKNTKIKGDMFEEFSVLYLKNVKKYNNVWLLKDVPDDILEKLNLKRRDMGIDLIAENNGLYYAVQCKYKKHTGHKKYNVLSWKVLSTFYALCLKTGPFDKYIVMTNCNYVRHAVKQNEKDLSICLKSFENITKDQWLSMCDVHNYKLENNNINNINNINNNIKIENVIENNNIEKYQQIKASDKSNSNNSTVDCTNFSEILADSKDEIRKKRLLFYQQKN